MICYGSQGTVTNHCDDDLSLGTRRGTDANLFHWFEAFRLNIASFPFCNPILWNNVKTTRSVQHMHTQHCSLLSHWLYFYFPNYKKILKFHSKGKYSWPLSNMEINLHIICQPFVFAVFPCLQSQPMTDCVVL